MAQWEILEEGKGGTGCDGHEKEKVGMVAARDEKT